MARLANGIKTPTHRFYIPILRALQSRRGRARVRDLYDPVKEQLSGYLNDADLEYLEDNTSPEPRWMNTMRVARDEMIKQGLLERISVSGYGFWSISEKGRAFLKEWQMRTGEDDVWL